MTCTGTGVAGRDGTLTDDADPPADGAWDGVVVAVGDGVATAGTASHQSSKCPAAPLGAK